MALTSVGFEGYINLVDSEGSRSTLRYALTAANFTDALSAIGLLVTRIGPVTDAVIESYGTGEKYAEDALALPAGVEIEKRAVLTCKIADSFPQKYVNLFLPAPSSGIFLATTGPNAKVVDTNDADIIAYLSSFEDAGLATVSDGESIIDTATAGSFYGHKTHRGSRNG